MAVPNFRLEIRKQMQNAGRTWSNDYLLNCTSLDDAQTVSEAILAFERQIHFNVVSFLWYRVSTILIGDRTFRHIAVNLPGLRTTAATEWLPLFNCVRVDLTTLDHDPARKYYRLPLFEADTSNGGLTGAFQSATQTLVNTHLVNSVALDNIVTPKGYVVGGAAVHAMVQERQLTRRRKKKVTTP